MFRRSMMAAAAALFASAALSSSAGADEFLGSYIARLSPADHHASDGYRLDNAAQVVRQDRANVHKFGRADAEDEFDPWFGSAAARARFQSMLERNGAMSPATRQAIMRGTPLVEVEVYVRKVVVSIIR